MVEDKHYNDVVRNMLQDTGIKTKIVKRKNIQSLIRLGLKVIFLRYAADAHNNK